jgi:hypothetical protein
LTKFLGETADDFGARTSPDSSALDLGFDLVVIERLAEPGRRAHPIAGQRLDPISVAKLFLEDLVAPLTENLFALDRGDLETAVGGSKAG